MHACLTAGQFIRGLRHPTAAPLALACRKLLSTVLAVLGCSLAAKAHRPDTKETAMLAALGRGVVGAECVVGEGLTVGAKSTVKKSSLGAVRGVRSGLGGMYLRQ